MRGIFFRRWCLRGGGALLLALAVWESGLAGIGLAATPEETWVHLRPGEARDVVVDLGRDSRPDLDFLARLIPPDQEAWKNGLLTLSFPDANDASVLEQRLPHQPNGRRVRIRIAARHCSPPGPYLAHLEISAIEKNSERPVGASRELPLRLDMAGDGICASTRAAAGGSALLIIFLGLYVRLMFFNSAFLTPSALASRLQPLRWREDGEGVERTGERVEDLGRRIARKLPWSRRIVAWLAANPLVFGLPGKRYEETVQVEVGRRPDDLFLTPVPKRRMQDHLADHPEEARGRLFAKAEKGGGVSFFGMPDGRGYIGRLLPGRSLNANQLSHLNDLPLVEPEPPEERVHRPAGWRIVGGRR